MSRSGSPRSVRNPAKKGTHALLNSAIATAAWAPLQHRVFRMLWFASIISNIGSWMHEVGAGWLMTSLAPTPLMVALVQAATTAPVFLLAIPAGALADIVDRRRHLIVAQTWMMITASVLGVLTLAGWITAPLLLLLTFSLGVGTAMTMPAWGAIVPELITRPQLPAAIALNSVGMNISRTVGPALAGVIVAATGPGAVFCLNALSFLAVLLALRSWQRPPRKSDLPAERQIGAIRAGLRYARHSPELRAVLTRGIGFFVFASASWALLPLIVRQELASGPGTYGAFLACLGIGAVCGALLLPRLHGRITRDKLVAGATVLYAIAMLALAHSGNVQAAGFAMLLIGLAWISVVSSLMTATQPALPSGVRARPRAVLGGVHGRHGGGQRAVGAGCLVVRHPHRAHARRDRRARWHAHHVAFSHRPSRRRRSHAVDALADADGRRARPRSRTRDGYGGISHRSRAPARIHAHHAADTADTSPRRRLHVGAVRRRRRPRPPDRVFHGRIVDRASAPARTRDLRRSRHQLSGACLSFG